MSASSVTSKSTTATTIADDTTNTPYNPDKQRPRSPSASDIVWKRSKTGKSLLTPLSTEATRTLSDPPPPLVDGLPTPYPPVPPPAPRYCTRQTVKQMQATADAVTKQELAKLQQGGRISMLAPPTQNTILGTPSDQNGILQMMTHVNQTMVHVNQLMDENTVLRRELKKSEKECIEKSELVEHSQGIAESYEEDIQVLTEERDAARAERDEALFSVAEAQAATRAVQASIPRWCLFICALVVLVGLHINYEYNLNVQKHYSDLVYNFKTHYWVWVTTCFVEEGNAAERAQGRAVPRQ